MTSHKFASCKSKTFQVRTKIYNVIFNPINTFYQKLTAINFELNWTYTLHQFHP
jgi:hypothetical protein